MVITCIILAGGFGTRLGTVLGDKPKCLAPIGDKSFAEVLLEQLTSQGVKKFIFSLGFRAEQVISEIEKLRNRFDIDFVVEKAPLGTGGAIKFAMESFNLSQSLIVNGDTYLDGHFEEMLLPLDSDNFLMRMLAVHVEERSRFGGLVLDGDVLTDFLEKGVNGRGLINAGVYLVHKDIFLLDVYNDEAFSFEKDIMPKAVARRKIQCLKAEIPFIDIGVPEDYFWFCEKMASS